MLSVQQVLEEMTNSDIEVSLHFQNGYVAKGRVEKSKDLIDSLPFVLRSGDAKNGEHFFLFSPSTVVFFSFSDRKPIDLLFSARRIQRRALPAPTILELERLSHKVSENAVPVKMIVENLKSATDEMRWRLNDLITNLEEALREIGARSLGQSALAKLRQITLTHKEGCSFAVNVSQNELVINFDLNSILIEEKMKSNQLCQLIESHI